MATTKELGCGGRYSAYQFLPCTICPITTENKCKKNQEACGPVHEEWYTDLAGRAKWRATRSGVVNNAII